MSGMFLPVATSTLSKISSVRDCTSEKSFHPLASIAFFRAVSIFDLSKVTIAQFLFFTLYIAIVIEVIG
jgi:hypothetical protein